MQRTLFLLAGLAVGSLAAADRGDLILSDDFERNESQEQTDEPGGGWETNSRGRAKGNKQVDLRDGAMHIAIHEEADHAVSVRHEVEFTDGAVALRFRLDEKVDSLGLNFADLGEKSVHAGHLFVVRIRPDRLQIQDLKTGTMRLEIREARKAKALTGEQKEKLEGKVKVFPVEVAIGEWHELLVEVEGDTLRAGIDGEEVGSFSSEGIAHPTKRMLRLAVPRNAVVDDVRIWRAK